jgi:hypothetical protein
MKNIIETKPFIDEARKLREAIIEYIISVMKERNVEEVYCTECFDCPAIHFGICEDDVTTLDTIELVSRADYDYLLFNGSSEYSNGIVNVSEMDIELLVTVYDWFIDNQDELFEEN